MVSRTLQNTTSRPDNSDNKIQYSEPVRYAEVDSHCFDNDTMLFMDWRDTHAKKYPEMQAAYNDLPTFLYAMPFSDNRVFLEETSLVARPGVPFSDLKERLYARLKHLDIKVPYLHYILILRITVRSNVLHPVQHFWEAILKIR